VLLSATGRYTGPLMLLWCESYPGFFRITYRYGFDLGQIPADIVHAIAMRAAIGPLNIAGDLLIGPGIANVSTSAGGVSQSIGTTSSATNAGYGARIREYERELKQAMPLLRRRYQGIRALVA